MKNKNKLGIAGFFSFMIGGALLADCCSHAVINNSGKNIKEIRFANYNQNLKNWNVYATIKDIPAKGSERIKKFDTKQTIKRYMEEPYDALINIIVVEYGKGAPNEGVNQRTNKGEWVGDQIFIINPDFSITTL